MGLHKTDNCLLSPEVGTHLDFLGPQELKDPSLEGSPASIGSWELSIYCSTRLSGLSPRALTSEGHRALRAITGRRRRMFLGTAARALSHPEQMHPAIWIMSSSMSLGPESNVGAISVAQGSQEAFPLRWCSVSGSRNGPRMRQAHVGWMRSRHRHHS